jgi:hypothetical protein
LGVLVAAIGGAVSSVLDVVDGASDREQALIKVNRKNKKQAARRSVNCIVDVVIHFSSSRVPLFGGYFY